MFTIESTITLPHSPEAVFAVLASVEGALRWQAGVRGLRRLRRPGQPGALLMHYQALGARHALRARVTTHEPPTRFAYRAEGARFALAAAFTLEPVRDGARVAYRVTLTDAAGPGASRDAASGTASADVVALRRLLVRRVPYDLARLDAWVAAQRRPAVTPVPPVQEFAT